MLDDIRNEFEKPKPKSNKLLKILYQLGKDAKHQKITDSEFFDAIGETFRMQPEFFMNELYPFFMNKMAKIIGAEKRKEMERYILEKYCLLEDEKIIYELEGKIIQEDKLEQKESGRYKTASAPVGISVLPGDIFLTNYRLIAHGLLVVSGGRGEWARTWRALRPFSSWEHLRSPQNRKASFKAKQRGKALVASNPIFGYQFPTKNHHHLWNLTHALIYNFFSDELKIRITIEPTDKRKRNEQLNNLFEILRRDPNEVIDTIRDFFEGVNLEKFKGLNSSVIIIEMFRSQDIVQFSDSDKIKVIVETYKLNPEFFLRKIYPNIKKIIKKIFNLEEELIELLRKEGAAI